jgi:RNA polymerase sigma factor (sigma-70 family)
MAYNPYQPDYAKLYPGVEIDADTLNALKEGDRKTEYLERDLKRNRYLRDKTGKTVKDENGQPIELPERETSFEVLSAAGYPLPVATLSAEDELIEAEFSEVDELHRCLDLLDERERELINALFFEGLNDREYAAKLGVKQQSVNERKRRILGKLKKMLES